VGWRREFSAMAIGSGESPDDGRRCPEALLQLCKSEGEGRHTGFEIGVTGEGSSPRCGHGSGDGSNFRGGSGSGDRRTAWRGSVGKWREGGALTE
jgi:hypothetical protein